MHQASPRSAGDRIWMIAGTGEGPKLATKLLARGWRVEVSVVTRAAALAYPTRPGLKLMVGALGARGQPEQDVSAHLINARQEHDPYRWVIDASHPFACRISNTLVQICAAFEQSLLGLQRPLTPHSDATVKLASLTSLRRFNLEGTKLLFAIGARQLAEAVQQSPDAHHHARILPNPRALAQAMAAGLSAPRVACLRPGGNQAIEQALCKRWQIESVVCRESGGVTQQRWQAIAAALKLRLFLLERPATAEPMLRLPMETLLKRIGKPSIQVPRWVVKSS